MGRRDVTGVSRSVAVALALGVLLGAVLVVRPLAYQLPAGAVLTFWAFVLLVVAFPGIALTWAAGLHRRDPALLLGQGITLGLALHGLVLMAGRTLGVDSLGLAFPVMAFAAAVMLGRLRPTPDEPGSGNGTLVGPLLVMLVGCLVQPLTTTPLLGAPLPSDLAYHAGNAAELRHRWPLEDPRVAGLPLNYPVLAYAVPVAASHATGLPVADTLHGLSTLFWIGLLALQVYNAGRVLLGDSLGATLGTAVVLLHEDVGGLLGLGRGAFSSTLTTALYGSPTSVCGLILLAALAIVIGTVVSTPRRLRALWPLLLVFSLSASLTKATVVPAAAGGCLLLAAWAHLKRRTEVARAALACALLLAVAAAPFTLRLGTGDTSYRGILRWAPGAVVSQSPFAIRVSSALGRELTPLITPFWLAGYLGLAGVGALVFLLRRREPLGDAHVFALGVAAAGAVPALLMDAHGRSQLFFLYNGQLLLGALAGGAIAQVIRARPAAPGLLLVLAVAALPSLDLARRALFARPGQDYAAAVRTPSKEVQEYASALAWLRAHATRNAVVFADNPSLLLSAFGECRMYYETGFYSPRGWERRWAGTGEPFPERAALQDALLRRPSPEGIAAVRRIVPPAVELLVVADSVQSSLESGFLRVAIGPVPSRALLPPAWFRPVFVNQVMHVYRVDAPAGGGSH